MTAKKKIQLTRRSSREIALRKGFELPAREGKGVIGFEDMGDLRFKYFHLEGRLTRWPFFARMLLLTGAQLVFTLILYTRFVEALWIGRQDLGILFFCIFIVLSIPVIRAQVSLGVRRCHDLNLQGAVAVLPLVGYLSLYILAVGKWMIPFTVVAVFVLFAYLLLFTIKGKDEDNIYGKKAA